MSASAEVASNPVNIARALYENVARQPEQTAIVLATHKDRQGKIHYSSYSFQELVSHCDAVAAGLQTAGIKRGMRTVLMVKPSLEFFSLMFAMLKTGIVPVLIDPGMGLDNLKVCLAEAQPEAFVGIPKAHLARIALGWSRDTLKSFVTVGRKLGWSGPTLEELLERGRLAPHDQVADTQADEVAAILFTSGSTGVPKGVVYTHGNFQAQIEMLRAGFAMQPIQPGEVDLATFPPFALFDPALGMTSVIPLMDPTKPAEVNPQHIFDAIARFGVTHMFGSPALINRVSRAAEAEERTFSSLKRVLSAGAPVPYQTLARMQKTLPKEAEIYTPYGATECLPVAIVGAHTILDETQALTAQGQGVCIGKPVPGLQVEIIAISDQAIPSWDQAEPLPAGQWGEITVKGPNVTPAYFNRDSSTALAKIAEGKAIWHRMGDIGYFDAQGRLWFCGRKSQRVITPQETLFTIPCEAVFNSHPDVYRTALVAAQREGQTLPVICVELEPTARRHPDQIRLDLLELAARYAHTRRIRHFLIHPGLPVDIRHNSKIFREKLVGWASARISGKQR